jgi:glycosyltransferase involved in cell wall biosynthesis
MHTFSDKKVACIMPVYNYARYLDEALQSVFSQSRVPDEVIVVDDCSTDNPKEICDKYPQVKYIKHDSNKGLAAARNTGVAACTSDYVFSFDADDILRPDAVLEHLKLMDDNSIVTCGLMAFGAENYTAYPREATVEILLQTNVIYSNTMFPKKAWEDVGGFDESPVMRFGWEDREFWLRVIGAGYKSKVGNYVALLWRRHPQTMSSTTANPNAEKLQRYIFLKNQHLLKTP